MRQTDQQVENKAWAPSSKYFPQVVSKLALWLPSAAGVLCLLVVTTLAVAAAEPIIPPANAAKLQAVVNQILSQTEGYKSGDLISQTEVENVLKVLIEGGVKIPPDVQRNIIGQTLPSSSSLIKELNSDRGRAFAKQAANPMLYDQLDRITRQQGGALLVHDMIRLPDGYRYARKTTPQGAINMRELLPKTASGNAISKQTFEQPTGRIYTEADLVKALTGGPNVNR